MTVTSMCHSVQLKGWVGIKLPVVFSKSVTLGSDDLTLIFSKEKTTQSPFKAHF